MPMRFIAERDIWVVEEPVRRVGRAVLPEEPQPAPNNPVVEEIPVAGPEPEPNPARLEDWQGWVDRQLAGIENRPRAWRPMQLNRIPPWARKKEPEPVGKRGEELFQLILSGIREIYDVQGTIAGGAVRDHAAGLTDYKDVDVFLPLTFEDFSKSVQELGWSGIFTKVKQGTYAPKPDGSAAGFWSSARGTSQVQGVKVDLVFMEKPLEPKDVATFPVHAQRGIWTLDEGLVMSPEMKKDIENKTFTIDPTLTDEKRLFNCLNKIKDWQKRPGYKGWKIVEPEIEEWWAVKKKSEDQEKNKRQTYEDIFKNFKDIWDEVERER